MDTIHADLAGSLNWILIVAALAVVCCFEAINGFHDTANAVATVIYTHSLRPWKAVVWSGFCNFLGVYLGGIAVAFTIVHLLPVELLVNIETHRGLAMVFSLLGAAIVWNFGTWFLGLPSSSSHALIGSILGVGLANSVLAGKPFGAGVNWEKAAEVGLSLLLSPVLGMGLAGILLLVSKRVVPSEELYQPPADQQPPPRWIRAILLLTCTGVSFAHGSNDGQKGVGIVMLILIGLLPAHYVVNLGHDRQEMAATRQAAVELAEFVSQEGKSEAAAAQAQEIESLLSGVDSYSSLSVKDRWQLRTAILDLNAAAAQSLKRGGDQLGQDRRDELRHLRAALVSPIEYAPTWVLVMVALSLGVGTTIGWKRIVVTVGEKIGKVHLTYGQGACSELVAMSTIGLADGLGFPVSTTHVLSSAVAGTMVANRSGVQLDSIKKIAWAWVLTLPATVALAGGTFFLLHVILG
ncbi:MAG TPA: inorganic phosphate transporter [Pirellulales bacterium]|nr:inorganic phosphate transporter [Pirellulales bacterium]